MKKIPVLDTIRYAYAFTFGQLGTIIGLIWLPMLLAAVPGYFVAAQYYAAVPAALEQGNPAAVGQSFLVVLVWGLAATLLSAIMYTAVTRQALGLREGPAVFHFALGIAEMRVFGAVLGLFALALLFMIAGNIVAAIAVHLGGKATGALVSLLLLLAVLYGLVRLSFLLVPATVARQQAGFAEAWRLSGGNFWRIVLVGIAVLGPVIVVAMAIQVALLGPGFFLSHGPTPQDQTAQMQAMAEQMRIVARHLPELSGVSFVMAPLFIGLALAPAAYAWRALTGPEGGFGSPD